MVGAQLQHSAVLFRRIKQSGPEFLRTMTTAAQIRDHYDSLAFIYRAFWGDHIHHGLFVNGESPDAAQVRLIEHCAQLLKIRDSAYVLDVGCGHGGTSVYLAAKYGCRVLGLTLSDKQLRLAAQNAQAAAISERVSFAVQDADRWDFPAQAFDLVWTMESSEHFSEKMRYFRNVASTLRPGGWLLLTAWTGSMHREQVRQVAQAFLCPELWTVEQYRGAIENAGMRIQAYEDLTRNVLPTWEICAARARSVAAAVKLLPRTAREFVEGIPTILKAYKSGDLNYTVFTAQS
jgi:tocopherol O-methyltransferase